MNIAVVWKWPNSVVFCQDCLLPLTKRQKNVDKFLSACKMIGVSQVRFSFLSSLFLRQMTYEVFSALVTKELTGWRRGVVVSGVRQWTKLTHVGPGYNWDGWPSSGGYTISGCNQPTRSTQPCIPPRSLNRVPASAGVKAGMSHLPGGG